MKNLSGIRRSSHTKKKKKKFFSSSSSTLNLASFHDDVKHTTLYYSSTHLSQKNKGSSRCALTLRGEQRSKRGKRLQRGWENFFFFFSSPNRLRRIFDSGSFIHVVNIDYCQRTLAKSQVTLIRNGRDYFSITKGWFEEKEEGENNRLGTNYTACKSMYFRWGTEPVKIPPFSFSKVWLTSSSEYTRPGARAYSRCSIADLACNQWVYGRRIIC